VSITFTLCREDTASRSDLGPTRIVEPGTLDPWRRLEAIARQVLVYGAGDPYVSDGARVWAQTTIEMLERLTSGGRQPR
jgi:hypothetical protein